jgi:hypothetical protein
MKITAESSQCILSLNLTEAKSQPRLGRQAGSQRHEERLSRQRLAASSGAEQEMAESANQM